MEQSWGDALCPLLWEETSGTNENVDIGGIVGLIWKRSLWVFVRRACQASRLFLVLCKCSAVQRTRLPSTFLVL